jgi:hypothetical protein
MTRSDIWWCLWLALVGSVSVACGASDDQQGSDREGDIRATGGTTSTGGRPSQANADVGGSGGIGGDQEPVEGGANGAAGASAAPNAPTSSAGASGAQEASLASRALAACQNRQAVGYVFGCMAVYESGYLDECTKAWLDAAEPCRAEAENLLECSDLREAMDYECDEARDVVLVPGVCQEEIDALAACSGG